MTQQSSCNGLLGAAGGLAATDVSAWTSPAYIWEWTAVATISAVHYDRTCRTMDDPFDSLWRRICPDDEPEDLDEELVAATEMKDGKHFLNHPCCCQAYELKSHRSLNRALRDWRDKRTLARDEGNWQDYVFASQKLFYPQALEEIEGQVPPAEWAPIVKFTWWDSDQLSINADLWRPILDRAHRIPEWMTPEERAKLEAMNDPLTVYRGCLPEHVAGMSWSIDWDAAYHFGWEIKPLRGVVATGSVRRAHVLGYFDNEEQEIVVLPEHVDIEGPENFTACY